MTVDETWLRYDLRENKKTSGQWQHPGQAQPEVGRIGLNNKKVMATVFWNSKGIVHIDYLETGRAINKKYYGELLKVVNSTIAPRKRKKLIFLQDNAPPHRAKDNIKLINEFGWKLPKHPPYSPDLSPSDFYLFKLMKNELFRSKFDSGNEAETEVTSYFASKSSDWFYHGISMIRNQFLRCIENKGAY